LLFFETDKVFVVLSGFVLMKNHEKNCENPETMGKFGEGSILNFLQEKSRVFNSIETWFTAQVETEFAVFPREYILKVWKEDIMTDDLLLRKSILSSLSVFANFQDLTLISLVSEII
jgi:hypothetical protein